MSQPGERTDAGAGPPTGHAVDPRPEPPPPARGREAATRTVRLVALLLALVLAVLVVATTLVLTGPPARQELMERAGLVGKRELLIGVKDDQPGISLRDPSGAWSGFDIDIARMIAADLEFRPSEVRFFAIESEDRARRQATDDEGRFVTVDLVIASYSVTPAREAEKGVSFSAPYLNTEQAVVTRRDYPGSVETLGDLRGRSVCTLATSTSGDRTDLAGVNLYRSKKISTCFADLAAGRCEAVTTDAAILAGFVARDPARLKIHDIGDDRGENWGVNTGDNEALRDLVNLTLYHSLTDPDDRRW